MPSNTLAPMALPEQLSVHEPSWTGSSILSGVTIAGSVKKPRLAACIWTAWIVLLSKYGEKNEVEIQIGLAATSGATKTPTELRLAIDWQKSIGQALQDVQRQIPNDVAISHDEVSNVYTRVSFEPLVVDAEQALRIHRQFLSILSQLWTPSPSHKTLLDIQLASPKDVEDLLSWNRAVAAKDQEEPLAYELLKENARQRPDSVAIIAHDGTLTYSELDSLSTQLAQYLVSMGASPGSIVPFCFEKSMWVPVICFAIMKSGAGSVTLDPSLPEKRLLAILEKLESRIILCSALQKPLVDKLVRNQSVQIIDHDFLASLSVTGDKALSRPSLNDTAHIFFTSGSTGSPKGVIWDFRVVPTVSKIWKTRLDLDQNKRVFQFSSYAFIAGILETLCTLVNGGTICIPTEHDRMNRIHQCMQEFQVNWALFVPSTASAIDPNKVEALKTIVLAGEPVNVGDTERWRGRATLYNYYAATECPYVGCYKIDLDNVKDTRRPIGEVNCWIVDPENKNRLAPVGAPGLLVVEGALVGRYLDPVPSEDYTKLISTCLGIEEAELKNSGKRICATGDLAKYGSDGSFIILGRANAQVKIRGQRFDLREVDHWIRRCAGKESAFDVATELIVKTSGEVPVLVCFIATGTDTESDKFSPTGFAENVEEQLKLVVPAFMIPSFYFQIPAIPKTSSQKIDRQQLQQIGKSKLSNHQPMVDPKSTGPRTNSEAELYDLCAKVVNGGNGSIDLDRTFVQNGGDSIAAMRLVSLARDRGLRLSVADLLKPNKLSELAKAAHLQPEEKAKGSDTPPFSMLPPRADVASLQRKAAEQCGIDTAQIEDILPCTALQEGMLSSTYNRSGNYVAQYTFRLKQDISRERLEEALQATARLCPILRTRFVNFGSLGIFQCVVEEQMRSSALHDVAIGFGSPSTWYTIHKHDDSSSWSLCWTLHHSIFDGWSLPLLIKIVEQFYTGSSPQPPLSSFQMFVEHTTRARSKPSSDFWASQFDDGDFQIFPQLPSRTYRPQASGVFTKKLPFQWPTSDVTPSNTLRATLALLLARYTGIPDVVFGAPVNGRQVALPGIEDLPAPTIATVPVRVSTSPDISVAQFLNTVHGQAVEMMPFEQCGLQWIQKIDQNAARACAFQTLLVVQTAGEEDILGSGNALFEDTVLENDKGEDAARKRLLAFSTYGLIFECQLRADQLQIRVLHDAQIIEEKQAHRMLDQFEHILRQLTDHKMVNSNLAQISSACAADQNDVWRWNAQVPKPVVECMHDLIDQTALSHPNLPAVCAWDGELSYKDLMELSKNLALELFAHGAQSKTVALCFEKSKWAPVAMLAVMKAGGRSVMLDVTQPLERLRGIYSQAKPSIILTSRESSGVASSLDVTGNAQVMIIDEAKLRDHQDSKVALPKVSSTDDLCVLYTSGSTGVPKCVVLTHSNFSSAVKLQAHQSYLDTTSRVFDFASYAFDIAWWNAMHTLYNGACLCIPSEAERKDDILGFITRNRVNYVMVIPSIAKFLNDQALKSLKTIGLGGEVGTMEMLDRLKANSQCRNSYGPAECTALVTVCPDVKDPRDIGHGVGVCTWVVEYGNPDSLVGVGCVGELWIEGPLVSKGYLNDQEKTTASFPCDTLWLTKGTGQSPGRSGRLYRTGDMVRQNLDGSLTFIGRLDEQVKLRGHRVELGEIEHHVRQLLTNTSNPDTNSPEAEIVAAVVTLHESDQPKLAVFITLNQPATTEQNMIETTISMTATLNTQLATKVPAYMIPALYIPIAALPKTTTEKIDRKRLIKFAASLTTDRLAALTTPPRPQREHQTPQTDNERLLQSVWAELLGVDAEDIGTQDSFAELGGDSIQAMQLVDEMRSRGVEVTFDDVLTSSDLADLAMRFEM